MKNMNIRDYGHLFVEAVNQSEEYPALSHSYMRLGEDIYRSGLDVARQMHCEGAWEKFSHCVLADLRKYDILDNFHISDDLGYLYVQAEWLRSDDGQGDYIEWCGKKWYRDKLDEAIRVQCSGVFGDSDITLDVCHGLLYGD